VGSGLLPASAVILAALGVCAVALGVVARRRHGTVLHPCVLLGGWLVVYGTLGYLIYPAVYENGPEPLVNSANAGRLETLVAFMVFGVSLLLVGAVWPRARARGSAVRIDLGDQPRIVRRALLLLCIGVAGALVAGSNLGAVVSRDTYQGFAGTAFPEAFRVGDALRIPALLAAWMFILSRGISRTELAGAWFAVGVFVLMDFATASRALALIPLLFLLAYWLTRGRAPRMGLVLAGGLMSLVLLSAGLFLRGTSDHGLVGYANTVLERPGEVASAEFPHVAANLLMGFPLAGYVIAEGANVDSDALWTSLNPLPRSQLETDPTVDLRVVDYMPYSSVGILGRLGVLVGVAYFVGLGMCLAWLWTIGNRTTAGATIARPVLVGVTVVIALMAVQYQLRTTTRIATLALVGIPAMMVILRQRDRGRAPEPGSTSPRPTLRLGSRPSRPSAAHVVRYRASAKLTDGDS